MSHQPVTNDHTYASYLFFQSSSARVSSTSKIKEAPTQEARGSVGGNLFSFAISAHIPRHVKYARKPMRKRGLAFGETVARCQMSFDTFLSLLACVRQKRCVWLHGKIDFVSEAANGTDESTPSGPRQKSDPGHKSQTPCPRLSFRIQVLPEATGKKPQDDLPYRATYCLECFTDTVNQMSTR